MYKYCWHKASEGKYFILLEQKEVNFCIDWADWLPIHPYHCIN